MAGTSQRGKYRILRYVWVTLAALALTIAVLILSGTIGVDLLGGPPWFFLAVGLGRLFLILASIMLGFGALAMLMRTVALRSGHRAGTGWDDARDPAQPGTPHSSGAPRAVESQEPGPSSSEGS